LKHISFADWPINYPFFFEVLFIGDCVPDGKIMSGSKELYIRTTNLKNSIGEIADANLKKIRYPNLLAG